MKRIGIVDYSMGNLRSVQKAVELLGFSCFFIHTENDMNNADSIIIPGVGSFKKAMDNLKEKKLIEPIRYAHQQQKPLLGICLGLQILFTQGTEEGVYPGLNLIEGDVPKLTTKKIPHMGWNQLHITQKKSRLLKNIRENTAVYFVHSYVGAPLRKEVICATCMYEDQSLCAAIEYNNVYATQFHPEKSGADGLAILKNFCEL